MAHDDQWSGLRFSFSGLSRTSLVDRNWCCTPVWIQRQAYQTTHWLRRLTMACGEKRRLWLALSPPLMTCAGAQHAPIHDISSLFTLVRPGLSSPKCHPAPLNYAFTTHGAWGNYAVASIVPHGDGWRAHIYVKGKRESKTCRTKREAERWAADRERELEAGGSAKTFGEAAERWLAWKLPQLTNAENQRTVEQSVRDYVLPALRHRKLSEIKRRELVAVVQAVADQGLIETSHRVGQRIRAIFDHAVDQGDIESHPAAGLARVLPPAKKEHMPAVKPAEVPALMAAINTYPEPVTRLGLQLLAHTFVRTSELIGARWEEFDRNDVWLIPAERMKQPVPHVVPITPQVRAILDQLRPMTDESPFVLASRVNREAPICNNTLLFALYRLGYKGRMTGHGFRSVASTILNESGLWQPDAIERQLAHKEKDEIRQAYHRAEYFEQRRRMMGWWSDYLDAASASSTAR
jgi:integrase